MVYLPFTSARTLTKPGVLVGLAILGGGVALTLMDEPVGILLLGVALFWFGGMMASGKTPSSGTMRR
jgi:hypothetical protein